MFYHPAKVPTLNIVLFAIVWCGNDTIAKVLPLIASGAGESLFSCLLFLKVFMCSLRSGLLLFAEKK
jgi:hypothetical protein